MSSSKPLVTVAELEALIHKWGASPGQSTDRFYLPRLAFNFVVMVVGAFWLLMDADSIARTLSAGADNIDRIKSYLYFRGWFVLGILILGCYAYFKNWYPALVFSCCLLIGAMNLISDLFNIYPERLASPTPAFTGLLLIRIVLLWVMFMSVKNASRMPMGKDKINFLLSFRRDSNARGFLP
jgi:hypothetical protein